MEWKSPQRGLLTAQERDTVLPARVLTSSLSPAEEKGTRTSREQSSSAENMEIRSAGNQTGQSHKDTREPSSDLWSRGCWWRVNYNCYHQLRTWILMRFPPISSSQKWVMNHKYNYGCNQQPPDDESGLKTFQTSRYRVGKEFKFSVSINITTDSTRNWNNCLPLSRTNLTFFIVALQLRLVQSLQTIRRCFMDGWRQIHAIVGITILLRRSRPMFYREFSQNVALSFITTW